MKADGQAADCQTRGDADSQEVRGDAAVTCRSDMLVITPGVDTPHGEVRGTRQAIIEDPDDPLARSADPPELRSPERRGDCQVRAGDRVLSPFLRNRDVGELPAAMARLDDQERQPTEH